MSLENVKILVENAELAKEYELPINKSYKSFIILEVEGKYTYQFKKYDGKIIEATRPNYGVRWYKHLKNAKQTLIKYFEDNKFIFKV